MRSQLVEVYAQTRGTKFDCSIVVPVWNGTGFLADSIPSVLRQIGVACDVLISDDCSDDDSLETILSLVKTYHGPHSVRVYRTSLRAINEHIPLLAAESRSERIIQAHQDDIADPERAKVLVLALSGRVKLVTSVARLQSASGLSEPTADVIESIRRNDTFKAYLMSGQGVMGGARYGMHRDIFDKFPQLSWDYLSGGQDILLHIRAHILGGCKTIFTPLLTIGDHPARGSRRLFDNQNSATRAFDFALRRLAILGAALTDLDAARNAGLVEAARARKIAKQLRQARRFFTDALVKNRELAIQRGYRSSWIKGEARET